MAFLSDMRELFHEMNEDDSDNVTWFELQEYFKDARVMSYFQAQQIDVTDAAFIYKLLDVDRSGSISIEEFCLGCHRLRGAAKCLDVVHLLQETTETNEVLREELRSLKEIVTGVAERVGDSKSLHSVEHYLTNIGVQQIHKTQTLDGI